MNSPSIRAAGVLAVLCAALALAGCEGASPTVSQPTAAPRHSAVAQAADAEILVRFRRGASPASRAAVHGALHAQVVREFRSAPGLQLMAVPAGMSVEQAVAQAAAQPDVLYAERNQVVHALALPDDPGFPEQWNLHDTGQYGLLDHDIDAPEAWDLTTGSRDVVVAVLDTGLDYTHPDLAANVYRSPVDCDADGVDDDLDGWIDDCHGIDVVDGTSDPMDGTELSHGRTWPGSSAPSGTMAWASPAWPGR